MLYIHGRIYFPLDDLLNKDLQMLRELSVYALPFSRVNKIHNERYHNCLFLLSLQQIF